MGKYIHLTILSAGLVLFSKSTLMPHTLIEIDTLDDFDELHLYRTMRASLHKNQGSFIADSPKVVLMLLQEEYTIHSVLATHEFYKEHEEFLATKKITKCYVGTKALLQTIVGHNLHHNVMMHAQAPKTIDITQLDDAVVMLDVMANEENIGAICRSAAALGIRSILSSSKGPQCYGRRALRTSMGHVAKLDICYYEDSLQTIHTLKALGYTIIAAEITASAHALNSINLPKKWVLLVGHEGLGVSQELLQACDMHVYVPMAATIKSLNVAIASSIIMYEFSTKTKLL